MQRLTKRLPNDVIHGYFAEQKESAMGRLAAIEDILGDTYDLDSLRKLMEADREGRCVVLPCKEGAILPPCGREYKADHWNVVLTAFADDETATTGKLLELFSVEDAQAALKGDQP